MAGEMTAGVRTGLAVTFAALASGVLAVSLADGIVAYSVLIGALAALLGAIIVREAIVYRDVLTPAGIVAATALLLFVLRPITVLSSAVTSPGAKADSRVFNPTLQDAGSVALFQCLLFFTAFAIVYYWRLGAARSTLATRPPGARLEPMAQTTSTRTVDPAALQLVTVAASVLALATSAILIQTSGGIAGYVSGISSRSEFLSGRSFLVFGYVPVQLALVSTVLLRRRLGLPVWQHPVTLIALASLIVAGLAGGGRGPFVVGVVLPLVLLVQLGSRPLRLRTIGVLVGIVLVFSIGYSVFVRTSAFDEGRTAARFSADPLGTVVAQLSSGAETRPFDSLIRLNEVAARDGFEYQLGATYASVPAWFVPRNLWAEKPDGGGNTWFTSTYVPRFYGPLQVETSLSAVGEAYANFGYLGVPLAGAALALLAAAFSRERLVRRSLLGATITVSMTPQLFSLVRGDAYQGLSTLIASVIVASLLSVLVSRSAPPTNINRPTRGASRSR